MIHILKEDGTEDDVDASVLTKTEGSVENDHGRTTWVEYRHAGFLVHRSVTTALRPLEPVGSAVGTFR